MPLVAGPFGERAARLLATLLVILHSLTAVAGTSVSLSSDVPPSSFGQVVVVESSLYPLIAIVTCTGGPLEADAVLLFGDTAFKVQLQENGNNPDQFFIFPNDTSTALQAGFYESHLRCGGNQSVTETAMVGVSVLMPSEADSGNQPYFTNSLRTISISASTPPGTVIANYTARNSREYVIHSDFTSAPFHLNSISGQLTVKQSLLMEGTLSTYDIVVVADDGRSEAWTMTTVIINEESAEIDEESKGSGISAQANKIILAITAIVSVCAGYILPYSHT